MCVQWRQSQLRLVDIVPFQARVDQDGGDAASVTEEDVATDTTPTTPKSLSMSTGRAVKPKKPDKNKMPPVTNKKGLKGDRGADPGYMSGGSQGQHSPLKGYGSPPAPQDGDHGGQWKNEDEITNILRHQTLSDPNDPTSPMALVFSPHTSGGGGGGYLPSMPGAPDTTVPMDQTNSSSTTMNPNVLASRQGRSGGLVMPAGRSPTTTQAPPPAKSFLHHPNPGPHPPPSYHQPPLYSPSRPTPYPPFQPSYQCYPLGYSSLPPESRQPLPPSSVPYTQLPPLHSQQLAESENTRINRTLQTPSSSGYSSGGSPKGMHQKSPSDDSSVVGGASIHSNPMTNSYSTFSSSSRVSSPSAASNRGDCPPHLSAGGPLQQNQFMVPKTSPHREPGKNYPLQQSLRMGHGRHADDGMSESSGRSLAYSSQSSRYSTYSAGSELSEDLLERLPSTGRRNFSRTTPLPLPESMQDQFEPKLNGTGVGITGMECSPPQGGGTGAVLGESYHHPQSPVSMQLDFHGDKTMPLYHLPPESAAMFTPNDAHLPLYSNSQCTSDSFDFQMSYDASNNIPNMMFSDMSFPTTIPDDTHYLETLLNSQAN